MKSIVNLKLIRTIFYFLKFNNNFKNSNYIFFCYNLHITDNLRILLAKGTITTTFVKKIKCSPYLLYFTPYLTNTLICFSCNTENDLKKLLPLIEHQIIISKINNNIYSINNISHYLNSHINLVTYCESYFLNLITFFSTYSKTLQN